MHISSQLLVGPLIAAPGAMPGLAMLVTQHLDEVRQNWIAVGICVPKFVSPFQYDPGLYQPVYRFCSFLGQEGILHSLL